MLVFEVAIQRSFAAQLPVGRTRTHGAPTVGVVDIALNLLTGEIDARTHLFAAAEQMAQVNGSVCGSTMIGGQIDRLNCRRPLRDIVDEPAGRGHAALHARNALEKFDALLVFQRYVLFAGNRHAVDLQAGGQIDRKSANLEVAVVAHRRIILANGRVVLHHIREQARNLVCKQVARYNGG